MKAMREASALPNQAVEVRRIHFFVVQGMDRSIRKIVCDEKEKIWSLAYRSGFLSAAREFPCRGGERGGGYEMSSMHLLRISLAQKISLRPTCICLAVLTVELTTPKVGDVKFVLGVPNVAVLVKLNASTRNSLLRRSVI
jgi:hypothetical protein